MQFIFVGIFLVFYFLVFFLQYFLISIVDELNVYKRIRRDDLKELENVHPPLENPTETENIEFVFQNFENAPPYFSVYPENFENSQSFPYENQNENNLV